MTAFIVSYSQEIAEELAAEELRLRGKSYNGIPRQVYRVYFNMCHIVENVSVQGKAVVSPWLRNRPRVDLRDMCRIGVTEEWLE